MVHTISPGKFSALFTVLFWVLWSTVGLSLLFSRFWLVGLIMLPIGLPLAGFMLPSLTHFHDVKWNEHTVFGPSKLFGLTLGLQKQEIRWDDIAKIGETNTGYWYIESHDLRRVYWSYLYKGYSSLNIEVEKRLEKSNSKRGSQFIQNSAPPATPPAT